MRFTRSPSATGNVTHTRSKRRAASPTDMRFDSTSSPISIFECSADRRSRRRSGSQGSSPGELGAGIPITYVPARNTIFLSFALAWAEVLGARDIFIGVNALDYSGYPDCRPEYIAALRADGEPRDARGVEGHAADRDPHTAIDLTKRQIIELGRRLGVDYALTTSCYDPTPTARACGHCDACQLRLRGFREAGTVGSRALRPRRTRAVQPRDDLHGQGDLLHAAGRGRERRAAGRVLPVHRLQPVDGARGGSRTVRSARSATRISSASGPDGGKFATADALADAVAHAGRGRSSAGARPLRRVHGRRAAAPTRRRRRRALHARGFEIAVETNGTQPAPAGIDWVCVSPKARRRLVLTSGDELKLVYPQAGRAARAFRVARRSIISSCSRWTDRTVAENTRLTVEYCLAHPRWRLSVQTHKVLGIRDATVQGFLVRSRAPAA